MVKYFALTSNFSNVLIISYYFLHIIVPPEILFRGESEVQIYRNISI